jgi:hypothetical protein
MLGFMLISLICKEDLFCPFIISCWSMLMMKCCSYSKTESDVINCSSAWWRPKKFTHRAKSASEVTNTSDTILCIQSFCLQKNAQQDVFFGRGLLKYGRHVDYWNQPLNMRIRVCYLHCNESGLRCYLMITHRKPLASTTAVLVPSVAYLLTLSCTMVRIHDACFPYNISLM